jgi:hypothetical protein
LAIILILEKECISEALQGLPYIDTCPGAAHS